ncbi:G-protein coupled receptor 61-like isoform X4 [Lampetra fluviatilis]
MGGDRRCPPLHPQVTLLRLSCLGLAVARQTPRAIGARVTERPSTSSAAIPRVSAVPRRRRHGGRAPPAAPARTRPRVKTTAIPSDERETLRASAPAARPPPGGMEGVRPPPGGMEGVRAWDAVGLAFSALLNAAALLGNLALLVVLLRAPPLRKFIFVLHLCVVDLLSATVLMPMAIASSRPVSLALGGPPVGEGDVFCKAHVFLNVCLISASILSVSAISVERYYYIVHPMRYEGRVGAGLAVSVLAFIWVESGLASVVPLLGWRATPDAPWPVNGTAAAPAARCSLYWSDGEYKNVFVVVFSVFCFVVPGLIVTVVYCSVFKVARIAALQQGPLPSWTNGARQRSVSLNSQTTIVSDAAGNAGSASGGGGGPPARISPERAFGGGKAAVTLAILVGQFVVCWLPHFAYHLHAATSGRRGDTESAETLVTWLAYSSFSINPFFYGWLNRQIREELKKLARCRCAGPWPRDEPPGPSSHGSVEENFFQFLQRTGCPVVVGGGPEPPVAFATSTPKRALDHIAALGFRIPGQIPEESSEYNEHMFSNSARDP